MSVFDSAIETAIARANSAAAKNKAAPSPPDIDALAISARSIIDYPDVLEKFGAAFGQAYAGEQSNAQLLYLVATSRLFDDTMHAAAKGASAVGKSHLVKCEDVITFHALSSKALFFMPDGFEHKILFMGEALNGEEQQFQDDMIRQLMSDGKLIYHVVEKGPDGKLETRMATKNGPVTFMVTTTKDKLFAENETRVLSLD